MKMNTINFKFSLLWLLFILILHNIGCAQKEVFYYYKSQKVFLSLDSGSVGLATTDTMLASQLLENYSRGKIHFTKVNNNLQDYF